jgi:hypothetical protein
MFETWRNWQDPSQRLFDYEKLAFPHEQYDPEPVFETAIGLITGAIDSYRNVEPKTIIDQQRQQLNDAWTRKSRDGLGQRSELVQKASYIKPGTPV